MAAQLCNAVALERSACMVSVPQRMQVPAAFSHRLHHCAKSAPLSSAGRRSQLQQADRRRSVCTLAAATAEQQALDVTKMAPLGDRLLVKPQEESMETAGGLIMTTTESKTFQDALVGDVVAVGDDVKASVSKGDVVLFTKQGSSDVSVPDGEVCFVAERSILAKLS